VLLWQEYILVSVEFTRMAFSLSGTLVNVGMV